MNIDAPLPSVPRVRLKAQTLSSSGEPRKVHIESVFKAAQVVLRKIREGRRLGVRRVPRCRIQSQSGMDWVDVVWCIMQSLSGGAREG